MKEQTRRTWAEVSLPNLTHNYKALRAMIHQDCRLMGMVKSDAYGHGALPISRHLEQLGADYLGVACLDEALELREGGVCLPILILGGTAPEDAALLLRHQLAQTIYDLEQARCFAAQAQSLGGTLTVHLKVDTGMTRLGFFCDEAHEEEALLQLRRVFNLPALHIEGIFTHFADSDGDEAYTKRQMTRFLSLLDKLSAHGCQAPMRHAANSAATLYYPDTHLDMVRPGIALYGHHPAPEREDQCRLLPVMELRSRITAVRPVPAGASVSYGQTAVLQRDSLLAVIPIGYGDGFSRGFSNCFTVSMQGKRVPIVGRVCMDMCMVDVTELPETQPGDEAVIYSYDAKSGQSVELGAAKAHTITYELLCALSKRIPRIYRDN